MPRTAGPVFRLHQTDLGTTWYDWEQEEEL